MTNEETNTGADNSAENDGDGDKPTQSELTEQTNAAAERLEKANEEAERINAETKQRIALGGSSDAGGEKAKPAKETDEEFTARVEAGKVDLTAK